MRVIPILSQPSKINVFFNELILQNCSLKYYSSFHSLMRDLGDIKKSISKRATEKQSIIDVYIYENE